MRWRWRSSIFTRLVLLVFVASLVPAVLLIGGSWYLNSAIRLQSERHADDALNLAINLEQTLIDARLNRMRERAVALAGHAAVLSALTEGTDPHRTLDEWYVALSGADLMTVVDRNSVVVGRANSKTVGDTVLYGGLVQQVLDGQAPLSSVVVIPKQELAGESAQVQAQVRMPILQTEASSDPRVGQILEDALALVGAAPVIDDGGRVLGAVLVSDILNNDHAIVNEVTNRSPQSLPLHATIALDGIRVTTTVPAVGGGKRAVGTLYSDLVMDHLRAGQEYRGRALVGGWQWERTIYLPLPDPSGKIVAGSFVGIPEANYDELARSTENAIRLAAAVAIFSLVAALLLAYRLALTNIARPLRRFAAVLTAGDLQVRVDADDTVEMARLASALNGMIERIRQTVVEMARVSRGVKAVSDELSSAARQTAANAEAALQVAASALEAAEQVGSSAERAADRMRELEVALARIDVGSEEQARALRHASEIVILVTTAVQDARVGLNDVLEATRSVVAAAQQGRHSALRTVSALEVARIAAQTIAEQGSASSGADSATTDLSARVDRWLSDLEEGQRAANECDNALRQISRAAEAATSRLWELSAVQNENGARAGAVSQQMADLSTVAEETAAHIRSMSDASRQVIGEVDAMAGGIESAVGLVRRAEAYVNNIGEASRRLRALSDRIRSLSEELDQATQRFPLH
ncbi:MAG: cache domain-containing protein [Bacillota bacterium]